MNANYAYFPLYIVAHGGGEFLVGVALTISSASEILAFFFSDKIIKGNKFSKIVVIISLGFIIRWFMLFMFPVTPIILISQLLHSITFGLFFAVGVDYVDRLSGEKFRATGQNIYAGVFMGLSAISGSLVGGKVFQLYGGENMYLFWSLISAVAGIIYSLYLFKKEKGLKLNAEK